MSGLTVDQQLVADSDEHTLCCALPGSGKSHTMIQLADNLLKKNRSNKVLLITFTKAAATELTERLGAKIAPSNQRRVMASTFDSLFGKQARSAGGQKKRTLVGGEQYNFIERALRQVGLTSMETDEAMDWINKYGQMLKPEPINGDYTCQGWQVYDSYRTLMKQNNLQDFNEIARRAYLGVQSREIKPWDATHILVDEFQDCSDIQYSWVQIHGELGAKIVCVADDDQSIYSFRNARGYENLLQFQRDFNATGYILKSCFRCKPEILSASKRLIEFNEDRVYKEMHSTHEPGGTVNVLGYLSQADEYQAIIQAITSNNENWAVLARTNRILDEIEGYLKLHNLPYKRLGGKNFWDDNTANICLKFFWSLVRPRDTRFIGEILGWLGEQEEVITLINNSIMQQRVPFVQYMPPAWIDWHQATEQLHQNFLEWGSDINDSSSISTRITTLVEFLKTARLAKGKEARLIEVVGDILQGLKIDGGFVDRVEMISKNLAPNSRDNEEPEKGVVTLSSLHSSKGLQWKQVWIAASNQGVCPSNKALEGESSGGVPEERRLYYVGMTRAVDELNLSFNYGPSTTGSSKSKPPSQFLQETFPTEVSEQLAKVQKELEALKNKNDDE